MSAIIPAQGTTRLIEPNLSTAVFASNSVSDSCVTLHFTVSQASPNSALAEAIASSLKSPITTLPPCFTHS